MGPTDPRARALALLHDLAGEEVEPLRAQMSVASVRRWDRGDHLVSGGERSEFAWFLAEGLTRVYALDHQGREHTKDFHFENTLTGSHFAAITQQPSAWFVQALEPCVTVALHMPWLEALTSEHPSIIRLLRNVAEQLFWRKEEREVRLLSLSAREHYLALRDSQPALLDRVPQRHIASYLGVTEASLSRLLGQLRRDGSTSTPGD